MAFGTGKTKQEAILALGTSDEKMLEICEKYFKVVKADVEDAFEDDRIPSAVCIKLLVMMREFINFVLTDAVEYTIKTMVEADNSVKN